MARRQAVRAKQSHQRRRPLPRRSAADAELAQGRGSHPVDVANVAAVADAADVANAAAVADVADVAAAADPAAVADATPFMEAAEATQIVDAAQLDRAAPGSESAPPTRKGGAGTPVQVRLDGADAAAERTDGSTSRADAWTGRTLGGRYLLLERLATGGMGLVFRARQLALGREVAVKVLRPSWQARRPDDARRRFWAEASVAARLQHPHSVNILDFGREGDGTCYLVMEYLRGRSLGARLRAQGPLSLRAALQIALQAAYAVQAAHAMGAVHRDLKPDNLMLMPWGAGAAAATDAGEDFVKLLDYGLVKEFAVEGAQLTYAGQYLGSPNYMAPEQVLGRPLDGRCDVYGLGAVLFEMVAGSAPFVAASPHETMRAHVNDPLPSPWPLRRNALAAHAGGEAAADPRTAQAGQGRDLEGRPVALAIDGLLARALAKDPAQRFATMAQMVHALQEALAADASAPAAPAVRSGHTTLALAPSLRGQSWPPADPSTAEAGHPIAPTLVTPWADASERRVVQAATQTAFAVGMGALAGRDAEQTRIGPYLGAQGTCGVDDPVATAHVDRPGGRARLGASLARRAQPGPRARGGQLRRWVVLAKAASMASVLALVAVPGGELARDRAASGGRQTEILQRAAAVPMAAPPSQVTAEKAPGANANAFPVLLESAPAGAAVYLGPRQLCATTPCVAYLEEGCRGRRLQLRFVRCGFDDLLHHPHLPTWASQARPVRIRAHLR